MPDYRESLRIIFNNPKKTVDKAESFPSFEHPSAHSASRSRCAAQAQQQGGKRSQSAKEKSGGNSKDPTKKINPRNATCCYRCKSFTENCEAPSRGVCKNDAVREIIVTPWQICSVFRLRDGE